MWYIQLFNDTKINSEYDFLGHQFIEKCICDIYHNIEVKHNEDYKRLNKYLEEHIIQYVNNMSSNKIELMVYNYGIDNAILLLNNYVVNHKKHINTTSKSLLFSIFISKFNLEFTVEYTTNNYNNNYVIYHIIKIQRFWRNILMNKNKNTIYKVQKEFDYVLDIINKQIKDMSVKNILIYIVNKYRRRISTTLRI
jgi:hypothetical protein